MPRARVYEPVQEAPEPTYDTSLHGIMEDLVWLIEHEATVKWFKSMADTSCTVTLGNGMFVTTRSWRGAVLRLRMRLEHPPGEKPSRF